MAEERQNRDLQRVKLLERLEPYANGCFSGDVGNWPQLKPLLKELFDFLQQVNDNNNRKRDDRGTMKRINTNKSGYVNINGRNWSYAGDKGAWARVDTDEDGNQVKLTVKRAGKGIMSDAYESAMREFCKPYGINFADLACGATVSVDL